MLLLKINNFKYLKCNDKDKALFGYNIESRLFGEKFAEQIKEITPFEHFRVAPLKALEVIISIIIN